MKWTAEKKMEREQEKTEGIGGWEVRKREQVVG